MANIEIKRADELGERAKRNISDIFVDGFGHHLAYFSKNPAKLVDALEHMFVPGVFYIALIDGEPAGIATCARGDIPCINQRIKVLIKHLGFIKGTIADLVFKREFQKPAIEVGDRIASVGFVATSSKHRGKGVATALLRHFLTFPQFDEYVLEVADNNTKAISVYEKIGYKEFKRAEQKYKKQSGFDYLVYMKYVKENEERIRGILYRQHNDLS